eukprot:maker-scaffold_6-snap-gene-19.50-mRNA-1 protein AED:0.00 eAED:0.00 QI:166/1/1/1/1/0.66/3/870/275
MQQLNGFQITVKESLRGAMTADNHEVGFTYVGNALLNLLQEEEEETEICCVSYGVALYVLGAFCMAFGVNLQKWSINKNMETNNLEGSTEAEGKALWKQPVWVLGLVIYGSSGGLLSAALAFAEQSLLAPLMSVMIISNALLARFLLNEKIIRRDVSAMIILLCGVLMSTIFAPTSDGGLKTTEGLIKLYGEPSFIMYCVILFGLLTVFYVGNRIILAKIDPDAPRIAKFLLSISPLREKGRENIRMGLHRMGSDLRSSVRLGTVKSPEARSRDG